MTIMQNIRGKDADLVVDLKCKIAWRLPAKNAEEESYRDQANVALSQIAYDLQESVGQIILATVKIKSER